jgi:hypothetical protein
MEVQITPLPHRIYGVVKSKQPRGAKNTSARLLRLHSRFTADCYERDDASEEATRRIALVEIINERID